MTVLGGEGRLASVQFTGTRSELFGLLLRGYVLMLPTIGVYRFWMVTWKRRFYWHHTVVDGDPLEYSGHAMQLLIGFLFALAFFLPIYLVFFYLSTQAPNVVGIGYMIVALVLWFLSGYAIYRARDFRLSRTLWRGIRFDQKGSAWGYAFRRFGWSMLMVTRPRVSQLGAHASRQSRPLTSRVELAERVETLDRSLGSDPVVRPAHWSGFRLLPESFEFWKDGAFRLHDRVQFIRGPADAAWTRQRLYP